MSEASKQQQPLIQFTPTAVAARHDGWTAERQIDFIHALAESACVEAACRRVGMSDSAAYKLRNRPCGKAFRAAWDAALDCAVARLEQAVFARALGGTPRPVFFKGEQVGEWRHYDERLAMFVLRTRRAMRFGRLVERGPLPVAGHVLGLDPDDLPPTDPAVTLDDALDAIESRAPATDGNPE